MEKQNKNVEKYYKCEHCQRELKGLLGLSIHLTKQHDTVLPYLKSRVEWIEHLKSFEVNRNFVPAQSNNVEVEELKVLLAQISKKLELLDKKSLEVEE